MINILKALTWNSFLEAVNSRFFYILIFFAIILIGFSTVLGEMSFAEGERILINMGLTSIHLVMVTICLFLGNALIVKEISQQTYMMILSRPVSRFQLLLGKFVGLFSLINLVMIGLLIILFFFVGLEQYQKFSYWFVIWTSLLLESAVLISMALFVSLFLQSMVAIPFSLSLFFLGHWHIELMFFAKKSQSEVFKFVGQGVYYLTPNFDLINWRSILHLGELPSLWIQIQGWSHCIGWTIIFLFLSIKIFNRQDIL